MRRMLALAALTAFAASAASAQTWTKYVDGPNGTTWSYDAASAYKDKETGFLVIMQAIAKPSANLGPSAPGAKDGVGRVDAIDCSKKALIPMGAYKPSAPLAIDENWRKATPKKAAGPDNEALLAAVCPHAEHFPVK